MPQVKRVEQAMMVTEQEQRLVDLLRTVEHGHVTVFMQDGAPVRVEEVKKSIKL